MRFAIFHTVLIKYNIVNFTSQTSFIFSKLILLCIYAAPSRLPISRDTRELLEARLSAPISSSGFNNNNLNTTVEDASVNTSSNNLSFTDQSMVS